MHAALADIPRADSLSICRSVGLSVTNLIDRELWEKKNNWLDRDAVWSGWRVSHRNDPHGKGHIFEGQILGFSNVTGKMWPASAEPIEKLNVGLHIGAIWKMRLYDCARGLRVTRDMVKRPAPKLLLAPCYCLHVLCIVFLARSANLPTGLYILLALISCFF